MPLPRDVGTEHGEPVSDPEYEQDRVTFGGDTRPGEAFKQEAAWACLLRRGEQK